MIKVHDFKIKSIHVSGETHQIRHAGTQILFNKCLLVLQGGFSVVASSFTTAGMAGSCSSCSNLSRKCIGEWVPEVNTELPSSPYTFHHGWCRMGGCASHKRGPKVETHSPSLLCEALLINCSSTKCSFPKYFGARLNLICRIFVEDPTRQHQSVCLFVAFFLEFYIISGPWKQCLKCVFLV